MEDDGFQLVRSRRRKKLQSRVISCSSESSIISPADDIVCPDEVTATTQKVVRLAREMFTGDYYTMSVRRSLKAAFRSLNSDVDDDIGGFIKTIVCYGLGNFTESCISLHQLALLLCLKEDLLNKRESVDRRVHLFDPSFTATDRAVLVDGLGFRLIGVNERCRREAIEPTCFFMPHCDRELYENLLAANVNRFEQGKTDIILIGNSFSSYSLMSSEKEYQMKFPILSRCLDFFDDHPICNNYAPRADVFNNISVHVFRKWQTKH